MQISRWTFGRIVTACGLVGLSLASVVAFSMPYRFRSTATLKVSKPDAEALERVLVAAFTSQALADIIHRERLYADAPAADGIDRMRRAIQITPVAPNLAQVSFAYEDPLRAQRVSQALVGSILTANLSPAANPSGLTIQLIAPVDQPKRQIEHKRYGLAGLGLAAGLLFGVVLALKQRDSLHVS